MKHVRSILLDLLCAVHGAERKCEECFKHDTTPTRAGVSWAEVTRTSDAHAGLIMKMARPGRWESSTPPMIDALSTPMQQT